jgi:hypothetical protein
MGAYGIPDETVRELTGKTQEQVIDHLYAELEKCSDGDINTVRTLLVSLFAASLVGLSPAEVVTQLQRIPTLLRLKGKVSLNEEGA